MRTKGDKGTCAMGAPGCSLLSLWGTLSLSLIELSLGGGDVNIFRPSSVRLLGRT